MTDRELLEASARAAGRTVVDWIPNASTAPDAAGCDVAVLDDGSYFQPLHDSRLTDCMGDALRLAIRCGFIVSVFRADSEYAGYTAVELDDAAGHRARGIQSHYTEQHGDDPGAATRRAIVRAAAAMAPKAGDKA